MLLLLPTVMLNKLASHAEHSKMVYSKLLADLNGAQTAKIRCFRNDYHGRMRGSCGAGTMRVAVLRRSKGCVSASGVSE